MDWRSSPAMEEERHAPLRARGAQNGGGAAGPSTVQGEKIACYTKNLRKLTNFPCRRTLGRAMRRKARCLALAEAPILFFSVVLCWHNVKMCGCLFATPSFQCIGGGSVPPPMPCRTLGRAARPKARHLALAEAPNLFSLSYCVGKTLKSVNFCLQCPVSMHRGRQCAAPMPCRTLGRAARPKARRLALAES